MLKPQLTDFEKRLGLSVLQKIAEPFIADRGLTLYLKRDDLLHPIMSGNKWRKLKYILNHALSLSSHTLISMGGAYSNHLHALAYAGQYLNVATKGYIRGEQPARLNPSLADMQRWGMQLSYMNRSDYRVLRNYKQHDALPEQEAGYWIPEGGALTLALQGVTELLSEIDIDYNVVCVPCGTATTLAGLVAGGHNTQQVLGFSALKGAAFLFTEIENMLNTIACHNNNWFVHLNYHFGGFAKTTPALHDFIAQFAHRHGVQLDTVYTGKMLYGIYDLIKQDYFQAGQTIVAIHTGGLQGNRDF